jgi:hypothetical protein
MSNRAVCITFEWSHLETAPVADLRVPAAKRPRRITESFERLGQLDDAWGKPAQAAEWKQKLTVWGKVG